MTKIKDYLKKKEKKQEKSGEGHFGRRIFLHRLAVVYRTFLVVAVLGAAAVVVAVQMKNRVFGDYEVLSSVERQSLTNATVTALGENILIYTNDGASCIDKKGETLWDQPYEMQNPMMDICQNVAAIGDYNGRKIYVVSSEKTIGEIDTKMPLRSFAVAANGVVAAVLDDTADTTWIYLFDSSGNTLVYFKTSMKQNGYPIRVAVSDNAYLLGVSYFYIDNAAIRSSVAFYNFGPVGGNEIDNFVSGYDYSDTMVPMLWFFNNERAVAIADNRLMFYEGDQKPVSAADILLDTEIEEVCYGNGYVALIYNDVTGNALYKADIYNENGELADTLMLDMQFSDMVFHKDKVIVYNEQRFLVHTIGGMDNFEGDFRKRALALIPSAASYEYVVVTPDSVDTIELK